MKQINNGFCEYYYLLEDGRIYNKNKNKYIEAGKNHKFRLKQLDGNFKTITLRSIYKLVYDKYYCKDTIKDLIDEEWKEIEDTNGLYFVSNMGRIKSLQHYEAIILKPTITKYGYERLDIVQEGQRSSKFVHCLVAAAFLEKPDSTEMQIHHINFIKSDNAAANLQYLTPIKHAKIHKERKDDINGNI